MDAWPNKILLATDGSEDAELAAVSAVALSKETGSELHVVAVAEEYPQCTELPKNGLTDSDAPIVKR